MGQTSKSENTSMNQTSIIQNISMNQTSISQNISVDQTSISQNISVDKNTSMDQISISQNSVTTPHFHKCQGEPMKKAKNSQGFGKAMIIENLYDKKTYRKPRRQGEQ